MVDLSRIVPAVQIESVRLCEASFRSPVQPSRIADAIDVKASHDAIVAEMPGEDHLFLVRANFNMEVHSTGDEEELQAEIRSTFELSYRLPGGETFSQDELRAFAQINAVFNAWPYWREFVQASLARMSMPILTVPVFRLPASEPSEDDEDDSGASSSR